LAIFATQRIRSEQDPNSSKKTDEKADLHNKRVAILGLRMIELQKGDITKMKVDAIVNAANTSLLGGGGVDGAIHKAGGKAILEECQQIRARQGGCKTGEAVITTAGKLPAKYVIHAVGPVWHGGKIEEERLLASAYSKSLSIALENNVRTIAFPNISTGVYGFPKDKAAHIAINEVKNFLTSTDQIEKVIFVCYDDENYRLYKALLNPGK
jgi:O-acetyl-ADP-ribose deacetylase